MSQWPGAEGVSSPRFPSTSSSPGGRFASTTITPAPPPRRGSAKMRFGSRAPGRGVARSCWTRRTWASITSRSWMRRAERRSIPGASPVSTGSGRPRARPGKGTGGPFRSPSVFLSRSARFACCSASGGRPLRPTGRFLPRSNGPFRRPLRAPPARSGVVPAQQRRSFEEAGPARSG